MKSRSGTAAVLVVVSVAAGLASAAPRPEASIVRRQASHLRNGGYDFIIAGGGTSGLTVADRLSEAFPTSGLPPFFLFSFTFFVAPLADMY